MGIGCHGQRLAKQQLHALSASEEQQRRLDIRLNDLSAGLKSIEKAWGQRELTDPGDVVEGFGPRDPWTRKFCSCSRLKVWVSNFNMFQDVSSSL